MDAEGFLDRERRWMEGIFAASRPEDLSCLFHDTYGSKGFDPDDFFPMVMHERVAWPEYMAMARAALFKTAASVTATVNSMLGVGVVDGSSVKETQDDNSNDTQRQKKRHDNNNTSDTQRHVGEEKLRQQDSLMSPRAQNSGNSSPTAGVVSTRGNPISGIRPATAGSSSSTGLPTAESNALPEAAAVTIVPIAFGITVRGKTTPGPDPCTLFCFDLPSPGPVLTIVLDGIDGDPELFVSRSRVPPGGRGSTAAVSEAAATGNGTSADRRDWTSSTSYGSLRVTKIFPHDPK